MFRSVANTYRAAFSGLPRDVWRLGVVMLVNRAGAMVLPFIALYLTRERSLEITTRIGEDNDAAMAMGMHNLAGMCVETGDLERILDAIGSVPRAKVARESSERCKKP